MYIINNCFKTLKKLNLNTPIYQNRSFHYSPIFRSDLGRGMIEFVERLNRSRSTEFHNTRQQLSADIQRHATRLNQEGKIPDEVLQRNAQDLAAHQRRGEIRDDRLAEQEQQVSAKEY
jgi:hypothetical protein